MKLFAILSFLLIFSGCTNFSNQVRKEAIADLTQKNTVVINKYHTWVSHLVDIKKQNELAQIEDEYQKRDVAIQEFVKNGGDVQEALKMQRESDKEHSEALQRFHISSFKVDEENDALRNESAAYNAEILQMTNNKQLLQSLITTGLTKDNK